MASQEEINAALAKVRAHEALTDREKQMLKANFSKVRATGSAPPSTAKKRGDGIDRNALWRAAHEKARTLPAVRIDD